MANFKSSYARLARLFKKSRDKWKDKAIERHKDIRALEVKIRDLEASRARWKAQAKNQSRLEASNEKSSDDTHDNNKATKEGASLTLSGSIVCFFILKIH